MLSKNTTSDNKSVFEKVASDYLTKYMDANTKRVKALEKKKRLKFLRSSVYLQMKEHIPDICRYQDELFCNHSFDESSPIHPCILHVHPLLQIPMRAKNPLLHMYIMGSRTADNDNAPKLICECDNELIEHGLFHTLYHATHPVLKQNQVSLSGIPMLILDLIHADALNYQYDALFLHLEWTYTYKNKCIRKHLIYQLSFDFPLSEEKSDQIPVIGLCCDASSHLLQKYDAGFLITGFNLADSNNTLSDPLHPNTKAAAGKNTTKQNDSNTSTSLKAEEASASGTCTITPLLEKTDTSLFSLYFSEGLYRPYYAGIPLNAFHKNEIDELYVYYQMIDIPSTLVAYASYSDFAKTDI